MLYSKGVKSKLRTLYVLHIMLIELPEVLESIFSYEYTPGIYGLDIDTLDDFRENKVKVEKNRKYTSLLPFFCNCSDAIN